MINFVEFLEIIKEFLKKTARSDLQSQIDFVEFLNTEIMKTPLFMAMIQSLKELQSIKRHEKT
jgi:hypothetical protein